ncbi:MAG TPA: LppX_LprAFG lipoprotein [Nocardioidaceae bacterium]|nr:LppX_LprAFG lipoprotein [Nocardioidaceae bacterium]
MLKSRAALALAALAVTATAGCSGGDDGGGGDPKERLEAARAELDDANSIELTLETDELPSGVDGIVSAEGVGTHEPAFDGKAQVHAFGMTGEVPVVAIGGQVYVKLPFKSDYETFDLAEYDAPDPAQLLNDDDGLTSMITALEDVDAGETELDDETKVTPISGVLPGEAVGKLFPSVEPSDDFDVTFRVDGDDSLRDASITGPFYSDADDLTYSISLEASDERADISKPS